MKTLFSISTLNRIAELHADDPTWDFWTLNEAQIIAELLALL